MEKTTDKGEQMTPPKGYKRTELGVLPEDWEVVRLGDVAEFFSGGTPKTTERKYYGGEIPFIKSAEIYYSTTQETLTPLGVEKSSAKWVEKGDLLYALYGANSGEVAIAKIGGVINQAVLCIKNKTEILNTYFLYSVFLAKKEWITTRFLQGGQGNLSGKIVQNLQIPLPPLAEQEKIAEILSTWDTQIQNFETLIAEKQTLKKGLCQTLLTAKTRLKGFSGNWEVVRLGDIAEIKRGASPRPIQDPKWFDEDSKIHWIRISDINNKYLCGTEQKLSKIGVEKSRYVPINSLIMSMCATLGRPAITKIETCIHDGFVCFYNLRASEEFLFYYLKLIEERWKFKGQLGSQSNLNTDIIKNLQIPLPPLTEQGKIAEILSEADNEITLLEQKLESLKSQKMGLMQKLLNGKVRVKI